MVTKDWVIIGLVAVLIFLIQRPTKTVTVTETKCDTLFDTITIAPQPPKIIERWRDTIIYVDSSTVKPTDNGIIITMPLNKYTFEEQGRYKLELEGIAVKPIKFEFIQPTINNTITNTITRPKRITHGINIGAGLTYGTKGLDMGVYVGYGMTIKIGKR